jgi:cysteinyl-tRNA synthetase
VAVDVALVQSLIDQRLAARAAKNWAESDRLRDELIAMGITLKDNKNGTTTWDVARRSAS